jgi:hypothetical protein
MRIRDEHGDSRSDVPPGTGAVDEAVVGIIGPQFSS